jgi:hypothetical protein
MCWVEVRVYSKHRPSSSPAFTETSGATNAAHLIASLFFSQELIDHPRATEILSAQVASHLGKPFLLAST